MAPSPYQKALLHMFVRTMNYCRACDQGTVDMRQLADLMETASVIPFHLSMWESFDPQLLKDSLTEYEQRWQEPRLLEL